MGATAFCGRGCGDSAARVQPVRSRPSMRTTTVEIDLLVYSTRTLALKRPFGRKLPVARRRCAGDFLQTPLGDYMFDAGGDLRARPGARGFTAGLTDHAEVRSML